MIARRCETSCVRPTVHLPHRLPDAVWSDRCALTTSYAPGPGTLAAARRNTKDGSDATAKPQTHDRACIVAF
eukprot:563831-Rhodomonas_salina.2